MSSHTCQNADTQSVLKDTTSSSPLQLSHPEEADSASNKRRLHLWSRHVITCSRVVDQSICQMVAVATYLARPLLSGEDAESVGARFPLAFIPLSLDIAILPPEELGPGEATASALFIAALCFASAL
jgi:hypothetical protein